MEDINNYKLKNLQFELKNDNYLQNEKGLNWKYEEIICSND